MASESGAHPNAQLRRRRSTRIVQSVPLLVRGVDALGRPFMERTSSLNLNGHGCCYQSKHDVLKNMRVTLEIPHPVAGLLRRAVRGRVAWVQRPPAVRQLFQVALELEVSGNVWGISFPPEDWLVIPEEVPSPPRLDSAPEPVTLPPAVEPEVTSVSEAEPPPAATDNLRAFPSPGSSTDASLQLPPVAGLVADARQQIQAAAQEAASQAFSSECQFSCEQWEEKFAAGRTEIANQTARAIEKLQQETELQSREAHAAAAEALRTHLPRWLAPQLEQLTRDLTARLSQEALAQRGEHARQLEAAVSSLKATCALADQTAASLKTHAEQAQAQLAARAQSAARELEEAGRRQEETAGAQGEALEAKAAELHQQLASSLAAAHASWQEHVSKELETAHGQLRKHLESTFAEAQHRAASGLQEQLGVLLGQLQDAEQSLAAARETLQQQSQDLENLLAHSGETERGLERHSAGLQSAQQQPLPTFESEPGEALGQHRTELHRESEGLFEQMNARIRSTFEEAPSKALAEFGRQAEEIVQQQIARTEEAIHRLAGGRSLLDAALTLQQDRIRTFADEAFAESLARFRENLGTVEQVLHDSSQSITGQSLADLQRNVSDLKHQAVEELLKSAEWFEKKVQTQMQTEAEKAAAQTENRMRHRAGEISDVFATELDHSSNAFIAHTQTQMEKVVHDSFERLRTLFAEVAGTTAAAFTDQIQNTALRELQGYNEELMRSTARQRTELSRQLRAEQEAFLTRFQTALGGVLQAGVAGAQETAWKSFATLLERWKSMTDSHQLEVQRVYERMGEQAAERHKNRLEGVSNQWLLATVASVDHQSRDTIVGIAATAEEKLREACAQVLAGMGDSLRQRLSETAKNVGPSAECPPREKSANTHS